MEIKNLFKFCHREEKEITNYVFGGTSAIITSLALIIGLNASANSQVAIIGSLLVIALADNISDSLGIHIYQESQGVKAKKVWLGTAANFFTRLLVSAGFIAIVTIFPPGLATYVAIIYGLTTLAVFSYFIAASRKRNPLFSVLEHLLIAVIVVIVSKLVGNFIVTAF